MAVLEMENVSLIRSGGPILEHIDWRINPGESWVVMGANGSGKTSLMTLILGYQWPTEGTITVLGARYGRVDLREHRKRIAWVSHHLTEWMTRDHGHQTVRDLVAAGPEAIIGASPNHRPDPFALHEALSHFKILERAQTRFGILSQGEKTRVLLARAHLAAVDLIVMDEPCSGLDIRGREELLALIRDHLSQIPTTPIIYVTHHVEEIMPEFTHVLLLKSGRVLARGPKREVLTAQNLSVALGVPVTVEIVHGRPWARVSWGASS
ncbi:ABC transporter ATP-binding protein [Sulfobacillus harzensis]|uniref:ATP-binding cassette domain-containing protein n=1 Tax=Sulfobacillus harzensis TaxID=2729629 RepID=A0A7Y0L497_9FIRM|nr:ATP-binding cassette domain-containing protein [Sulfobacillus harzensis]NMP23054.1 ATP-binding cassette domain-containing protein [Sulfobacillus harzensis]